MPLTPQQIQQVQKSIGTQNPNTSSGSATTDWSNPSSWSTSTAQPQQNQSTPGIESSPNPLSEGWGIVSDAVKNTANIYKNAASDFLGQYVTPSGENTANIKTGNHQADMLLNLGQESMGGTMSLMKTIFAPVVGLTEAATTNIGKSIGQQQELQKNPVIGKIADFIQGSSNQLEKMATAHPEAARALSNGLQILAMIAGGGNGEDVGTVKGMTEVPGEVLRGAKDATGKAVNVAKPVIKGASELATNLAQFGTSQATGMSPNTITQIIRNPENFSPTAMKEFTPENVAQKAIGDINQRLSDLSDTGKEYGAIRKSETPIKVEPDYLTNLIKEKTGVSIDEKGNIEGSASSQVRTPGDISKLQQVYDRYQPLFEKGQMTPNEFLNMRSDLANMAKFEGGIGSSKPLENLSGIMRGKLNTEYRSQIKGLENLDTKFGPETEQLNKIKSDYFNKDGTLKDNAISKISNLTNKGRETILGRLEEVSPGITEKIATTKAVQDIQAAAGQKVGAYARGGLAAFGLATGDIPAIVGSILSEPRIATQILRGLGKVLNVKDAVLSKIIDSFENLKGSNLSEGEIPSTTRQEKITNINDFQKGDLTGGDKNVETKAFQKVVKNEDSILKEYMAKNGKVVNADNFRPMFKDEGYNGSNSPAVQEPASYLAKRAWTKTLSENPEKYATMYGGGSGAGKSSAIDNIPSLGELKNQSAAILDGNLSKMSSAVDRTNEAIAHGKTPQYVYVHRNAVEGFENGVVKRMLENPKEMGRIVPTKVVAENYPSSLDVIKKLYTDASPQERKQFYFVDNSLGKGNAKLISFEQLSQIKHPSNLLELLNNKAQQLYENGTITKEQYQKYTQ